MKVADSRVLDLHRLTLSAAAQGIRDRRFSSAQLTASYLQRIEEHDQQVHAWAWLDGERALAQARRADELTKDGAALGPLHGIPVGIKDIIYTKGIPTRMGSPIFEDFTPDHSAACVERLCSAGAFVMGKTVTTEFANQHPGKTCNPWNANCTPGGSSSGSAAAVAAGFVAGALGTQTRGSIIRPAAYCGIVGYKPSFGLISRFGVHPLSRTLDHVGLLTRSVDDAGLMASCLFAHDARDAETVADDDVPTGLQNLGDLERPPRLAAVRSPAWSAADGAQRDLFEANGRTLSDRGARIESVDLPVAFDRADEVANVIQLSEMAHHFRELLSTSSRLMSDRFATLCRKGLRYSAVDYLDALAARIELQRALRDRFAGYDAIITPPAMGEAPMTLKSTGDPRFCAIWTLCGVPSVTIPTGTGPRHLPMGLQVVGMHLRDRQTLQVANWCMQRLPFGGVPT